MGKKQKRFHVGLRTLKTAIAVVISMAIVNFYGATTSKLIFAMLGAMAAMEPTFKESLESCMTQIVGVFFGAMIAVLLIELPIPSLIAAGIGIVLVITLYNAFHIRFSPSLPCLIVVTLCTTPDIQPVSYAFGRFWDTAIGLGVGMFINTLVFPYDNIQKIRAAAESLNCEVIHFLEKMFDGENNLPDIEKMIQNVDNMNRQLTIFSNQWLLLHLGRHRREFESLKIYERKARQLVAQMEVLCHMKHRGRLNEENRIRLNECGADIGDERTIDVLEEEDIITNYHVSQLLTFRQELLDILKR